jgi:hypothetical protein
VSDVAGALDSLRIAVAETDALAAVTAETYDRQDWDDADPLHVERMASLLGLLARSASGALAAFHQLHGAVADAQPARSGEAFDYSDGTSPGRARTCPPRTPRSSGASARSAGIAASTVTPTRR